MGVMFRIVDTTNSFFLHYFDLMNISFRCAAPNNRTIYIGDGKGREKSRVFLGFFEGQSF